MKNRKNKSRNLLHNHPLLRKGGMHEKTKKAKRRQEKQDLRKAWFSLSAYGVLREEHANAESYWMGFPGHPACLLIRQLSIMDNQIWRCRFTF